MSEECKLDVYSCFGNCGNKCLLNAALKAVQDIWWSLMHLLFRNHHVGRNKFVCVQPRRVFTGFHRFSWGWSGCRSYCCVYVCCGFIQRRKRQVRVVEFRCHRVHHSCQLYVCIQAADHTFFEGVPCSSVWHLTYFHTRPLSHLSQHQLSNVHILWSVSRIECPFFHF